MKKYIIFDVIELCWDYIGKANTITEIKTIAKNYHWNTDGECMLCYAIIKDVISDNNKIDIVKLNENTKTIETNWNETNSGKLTVDVYIEK